MAVASIRLSLVIRSSSLSGMGFLVRLSGILVRDPRDAPPPIPTADAYGLGPRRGPGPPPPPRQPPVTETFTESDVTSAALVA